MKAEFHLVNPDSYEAEMTISMKIYQWKNVKAALEHSTRWHTDGSNFAYAIRDLVEKAESEFESSGETVSG